MTDPWTCQHCGARFPVPDMTKRHEAKCVERSEETE